MEDLDAHARAPEPLRLRFKALQKTTLQDIESASDVFDFDSLSNSVARMTTRHPSDLDALVVYNAGLLLSKNTCSVPTSASVKSNSVVEVFEIASFPGLFIYPSLLDEPTQSVLLDKLIHRDLSVPSHRTNLDLHYHMNRLEDDQGTEPLSFFKKNNNNVIHPRDPSVHKPITIEQILQRKLRWVTLGGQYDWTKKLYPTESQPDFPVDIAQFLRCLFPQVDAQAAIVNFYTPGDTLSVHRDVSEECDRGLISISIGCDALFLIGNQDGSRMATIRLHSGDVILMTGESRFAWHAVPKILPHTCPSTLEDWPYKKGQDEYMRWKGWLRNKRINLNVRQMRDG